MHIMSMADTGQYYLGKGMHDLSCTTASELFRLVTKIIRQSSQ